MDVKEELATSPGKWWQILVLSGPDQGPIHSKSHSQRLEEPVKRLLKQIGPTEGLKNKV